MSKKENERQAFLAAIAKSRWDDPTARLVFADWLDEHDEPEEAARHRQRVPSETWLREFAKDHVSGYKGEEEDEHNTDSSYGRLMYMLKRQADGNYHLPFLTPDDFQSYSDELWGHFEIVTGLKSPEGEYRYERPPFRCGC